MNRMIRAATPAEDEKACIGDGGQAESERPTPPPPQSEAERRATNHVQHEQRPVQPAADLVMQRRRAERNRQQEQRAIDDPVALRAAQGRILVSGATSRADRRR